MKNKKALKILSALSQETRLKIFQLLVKEGKKGLSPSMISEILQVPPATLSFHLSQLSESGILRSTKNGRIIVYSAKYKAVKKLSDYLFSSLKKNNKKEQQV